MNIRPFSQCEKKIRIILFCSKLEPKQKLKTLGELIPLLAFVLGKLSPSTFFIFQKLLIASYISVHKNWCDRFCHKIPLVTGIFDFPYLHTKKVFFHDYFHFSQGSIWFCFAQDITWSEIIRSLNVRLYWKHWFHFGNKIFVKKPNCTTKNPNTTLPITQRRKFLSVLDRNPQLKLHQLGIYRLPKARWTFDEKKMRKIFPTTVIFGKFFYCRIWFFLSTLIKIRFQIVYFSPTRRKSTSILWSKSNKKDFFCV